MMQPKNFREVVKGLHNDAHVDQITWRLYELIWKYAIQEDMGVIDTVQLAASKACVNAVDAEDWPNQESVYLAAKKWREWWSEMDNTCGGNKAESSAMDRFGEDLNKALANARKTYSIPAIGPEREIEFYAVWVGAQFHMANGGPALEGFTTRRPDNDDPLYYALREIWNIAANGTTSDPDKYNFPGGAFLKGAAARKNAEKVFEQTRRDAEKIKPRSVELDFLEDYKDAMRLNKIPDTRWSGALRERLREQSRIVWDIFREKPDIKIWDGISSEGLPEWKKTFLETVAKFSQRRVANTRPQKASGKLPETFIGDFESAVGESYIPIAVDMPSLRDLAFDYWMAVREEVILGSSSIGKELPVIAVYSRWKKGLLEKLMNLSRSRAEADLSANTKVDLSTKWGPDEQQLPATPKWELTEERYNTLLGKIQQVLHRVEKTPIGDAVDPVDDERVIDYMVVDTVTYQGFEFQLEQAKSRKDWVISVESFLDDGKTFFRVYYWRNK